MLIKTIFEKKEKNLSKLSCEGVNLLLKFVEGEMQRIKHRVSISIVLIDSDGTIRLKKTNCFFRSTSNAVEAAKYVLIHATFGMNYVKDVYSDPTYGETPAVQLIPDSEWSGWKDFSYSSILRHRPPVKTWVGAIAIMGDDSYEILENAFDKWIDYIQHIKNL